MADLTNDGEVPHRRGGFIGAIVGLHNAVFGAITRLGAGWFTGLAARFTFASVLFFYYFHSGTQKLGDGFLGLFSPSLGAYASILPTQMEQVGYEPSALAFFPWHVIVFAGTWTEIILPILIVIGLFSRIAAIGMIIFVVVQSYVDITGHLIDPASIGAMFDRLSDGVIYDQRLLWVTLLVLIVVNGPGKLSADYLLGRWYNKS